MNNPHIHSSFYPSTPVPGPPDSWTQSIIIIISSSHFPFPVKRIFLEKLSTKKRR